MVFKPFFLWALDPTGGLAHGGPCPVEDMLYFWAGSGLAEPVFIVTWVLPAQGFNSNGGLEAEATSTRLTAPDARQLVGGRGSPRGTTWRHCQQTCTS